MSSTYTVKSGDTLGEIARRHATQVAEIQALNPIITHPDYIRPGWELKLPNIAPQPGLPPPMYGDNTQSIALKGQAECDEELVDVAHITGEPHFYVLTDKQSKALKQEISFVQALMDELHQNLATALPIMQCNKIQDPAASCACAGCVKEAWTLKAQSAGLLMGYTQPQRAETAPLTTQKDLQGAIAALQEVRDWYNRYRPRFIGATQFESNWKDLQSKKAQELDEAINTLRVELAALKIEVPNYSSTNANSAVPDLKHGRGGSIERQGGKQTKTGFNVIEVSLFNDPTRRYYIRVPYRTSTAWNVRVPTRVMAGKPFNKQLGADLIKDIKDAVGEGRKVSPLGSLEGKITLWDSEEDNMLNTLHNEVSWTFNESDAAPYAVTAEAHAMRFASSASAGVNSWNPREGNIDVGVKGSAALSMAEASASLSTYFPDQGGYVANMAYRNALGEEVLHPVGVFRLRGTLELSCFAGANGQLEAAAKAQYKPTEIPAGATALLGAPTMEVGPSGHIGVKGGGFAGVQVGGVLTGAFEWVAPDDQGLGDIAVGQVNDSSNWQKLAMISAEGNAAVGVGMSGEFGISIANNRLAFNCKGSVVLGPGAGGGFGTVVHLDQVGKLMLLFCNALAEMDYRHLLGVTEDAFRYMASGLYQVATSPIKMAGEAFSDEVADMILWWEEKKATTVEAEALATYLIAHATDKVIRIRGQDIPLSVLPPETIGPMVYLLTEGVVAGVSGIFKEKQEQALVILLSEVRRWRQFIEVLEHCSPKAEKVKAMESLERINALLNGYEQDQFNRFIDNLAINQVSYNSYRLAWRPSNAWRKEKELLAARNSGRFDGLA